MLLVDDLEAYERDPGLYLDYRTEMIGIPGAGHRGRGGGDRSGRTWDLDAYDAFLAPGTSAPRDGAASERFVERFLH